MRASFAHRFVHPASASLDDRLPSLVAAGRLRLFLDRPSRPVVTRSHPLVVRGRWEAQAAAGDARVELRRASPHTFELSLRLDPPAGRLARWRAAALLPDATESCAAVLRDELEDGAREVPPAPGPRPPSTRRRAAVAAIVLAAALAGAGLSAPGSTPVSPTAATDRYRAEEERGALAAETHSAKQAGGATRQAAEDATAGSGEPAAAAGPRSDAASQGAPPPAAGAPSPAEPSPEQAAAPPPSAAAEQPAAAQPSAEQPAADPPAAPPPDRPAPGVYRYATSGWEEISVPGSRRTLPEETAQTVVHTGCGHRTLWQPIEERTDELAFCSTDGLHLLAEVRSAREFYGRRSEEHLICETTAREERSWSARCSSDGTVMTVRTSIGPPRSVEVGGRQVDAVSVTSESVMEGETEGTRTSESMVEAGTGLLLRTEVTSALTTRGPFGSVRYREEHRREILSLEPTR